MISRSKTIQADLAHFARRMLIASSMLVVSLILMMAWPLKAVPLQVEKDELKFEFIKLTNKAPLAVAKELGFVEDEGLFVTLGAQANWKMLLDRVITGELDGAHMLAHQPLAGRYSQRSSLPSSRSASSASCLIVGTFRKS